MEEIRFKIEDFEGPLDLLLHLVSQKKMKLYDIKIVELIDQYLDVMGQLTPEQMNGATEFVEMAARLVYLKSVALLPRSEEGEKLERELTGELVEYSLCKLAAARLADMSLGVVYYIREPEKPQKPTEYLVPHSVQSLLEAYLAVNKKGLMRKELTPQQITDVVATPIVPVSTGILRILKGLRRGEMGNIQKMFESVETTSEAVATFLALLELIRAGRVEIDDQGNARLNAKSRKGA